MNSKQPARWTTAPSDRNVPRVIGVLAIVLLAAVASSLPAAAIVTTPTTGGAPATITPPAPVTNPTTTTTDAFVNRSFGTNGSSPARPDAPVTTPTTTPLTTVASSPPTDRVVTPASVGTSRAPSKSSGPAFAFSTADIGRLSALGLVGVIGGWFVIAAGRRRREDDEEYDGFAPVAAAPAVLTGAPGAPTVAPLSLDRRQRRERRKLRNRLFHRDPSVDRRTEQRRRRW